MRLDNRQTADFCRSMALMLHSGISVADGIYLLAEQDKQNKNLLAQLGRDIDNGLSFPRAVEKSGAFDRITAGIVHAGSRTGRLEQALDYLAVYFDKKEATAKAVKNALTYPCIVLGFMVVVIGILLTKVLPVFNSVYLSLGIELTGAAALLMATGEGLRRLMPFLMALAAVILILFVFYKVNEPFRDKVKSIYFTRYGDKGISRKFNNARFCQAMAMGMYSGMTVEQSAELGLKLVGHVPAAAERVKAFCRDMAEYKDVGQSLTAHQLLPVGESMLLSLGIKAGNGDKVMADIARRMDAAANESLENMVMKIEPAMVLVSSLMIGMILLSVMLPLVNIMWTMG